MANEPQTDRTIIEEIELAGHELVENIKDLIQQGNVRRVVVRSADGKPLLELPLTGLVAVGGVVALAAPVLAALGALAALVARVKLEVERTDLPDDDDEPKLSDELGM